MYFVVQGEWSPEIEEKLRREQKGWPGARTVACLPWLSLAFASLFLRLCSAFRTLFKVGQGLCRLLKVWASKAATIYSTVEQQEKLESRRKQDSLVEKCWFWRAIASTLKATGKMRLFMWLGQCRQIQWWQGHIKGCVHLNCVALYALQWVYTHCGLL